MKRPRTVHIHYHRPPDRTDVFVQDLVHDDSRVKVTCARNVQLTRPLVVSGEVVLEAGSDAVWFTFPGAWHDIGRFHLGDGTLTGIYANVLTPCVFEPGDSWHTTDLFLDLWIPALDGVVNPGPSTPELLDSDELEHALESGWIGPAEVASARSEAKRLGELARRGEWPPPIVFEWTRERALKTGP